MLHPPVEPAHVIGKSIRETLLPDSRLVPHQPGTRQATLRSTGRVPSMPGSAELSDIPGYDNDSAQNGPFGYLSRQPLSNRRRTEVLPMPSRLAISDFESFSLR